jgi:hypothetical protein
MAGSAPGPEAIYPVLLIHAIVLKIREGSVVNRPV